MMHSRLSETTLKANLKALFQQDPFLAERICEPMAGDHIELFKATSGDLSARLKLHGGICLHSADDPMAEGDSSARALIWEENRSLFCLGLGLGFYLEALLKRSNPCQPIIAYERDPWLLRATLSLFDFSRDILAGRLKLLLGADIITLSREEKSNYFLWLHPVLGQIYDIERNYLASMNQTTSSSLRAMVVSGGLFVADIISALKELGIQVLTWDPKAVSKNESLYQVRHFSPNMVFSVNYCHGLPEMCESLGIPYLVWEIDPSPERLHDIGQDFSRTRIYTYRKSHVARYKSSKFEHVEYLPLATNPKRRFPLKLSKEEARTYSSDVSFVGSSMTDQAGSLFELYKRLAERHWPLEESSPPGYLTFWDDALARQESAPDTDIVEDAFRFHWPSKDNWIVPDESGRLIDLSNCVAERAASNRRVRILSALATHGIEVSVWGDEGWKKALPEEARYCGPAGHLHELNKIYNAAKINLDINRLYQEDIVTMRVFDVLACKGFVLADSAEDLAELFDVGQEVISYRSPSEAASLIEHFLANEQDRKDVAAAGYKRVLRDHTITKRVQHMLQDLP